VTQQGVIVKHVGFRFRNESNPWKRVWAVEAIVWGKIKRDVVPQARATSFRRTVSSGMWGRRAGEAYNRILDMAKKEMNS